MREQEGAGPDGVRHEDAYLVRRSTDGAPSLRASAVAGLRRRVRGRGAEQVPGELTAAILQAAVDPVARVRVRAVSALVHVPVDVGFPVAAAALDDDDHAVREAAGRALVAMAPARAGVLLAELCRDVTRGPEARAAGLTAIRMLPGIGATVWSALVACLGDEDTVVRGAALSSMRALATRPGPWYPLVCRTALEGTVSPNARSREISLALARQVNAVGYQDRCRELGGDPDPTVRARARRELTLQPHLRWRIPPTGSP